MTHGTPEGRGDQDVAARRVVAFATGVGNFTEWFDFAVYGFLAATLGRLFFPSPSPAVYVVVVAAVCTPALVRWLPEVRGRTLDATATAAVAR
ncbi:MAG TPA: hypothetical protein VKZ81_11860 [Pseudonocardia sp.]|uniref:hypothetical protein n=1 Tax=Pseudonocardia sp. TaxID=60912 RepID=UPI002B4AD9C4|nr:hypothetical protein [Pseudonocardia sp.]HLU56148.1 hypothetical protein [Pseudonocardia sp.]